MLDLLGTESSGRSWGLYLALVGGTIVLLGLMDFFELFFSGSRATKISHV